MISGPHSRPRDSNGLNWPGRGEGLTDRESEILALITQAPEHAVRRRPALLDGGRMASRRLDRADWFEG